MKKWRSSVLCSLALWLPSALAAQNGAALYAEKTCIACHGPQGKKPLLPNYPRIAGQIATYTEKQMKDIRSGARTNGQTAAMKGIMHLVSDEDIKTLSTWLESLK